MFIITSIKMILNILAVADAAFVASRRGQKMLYFNGRNFNKCTEFGSKVRWRCSKRNGCKAYVTTVEDRIVKFHDEHNHF